MTGTTQPSADQPSADTRTGDTQLRTSVVLVGALVVTHLVMGFYVDTISRAVKDAVEPLLGAEPALLAVGLTAWAPLAVVVLVWGRPRDRAVLAALVAAGFATLGYLRGVVVDRLTDSGDQGDALTFLDWSTWVLTSLIPVGAALVWSIARRHGTGWWPGLLAAAVLASAFRGLEIDAFEDNLRPAFAALVYHVIPALAAGLACWWIEVRAMAQERHE